MELTHTLIFVTLSAIKKPFWPFQTLLAPFGANLAPHRTKLVN